MASFLARAHVGLPLVSVALLVASLLAVDRRIDAAHRIMERSGPPPGGMHVLKFESERAAKEHAARGQQQYKSRGAGEWTHFN